MISAYTLLLSIINMSSKLQCVKTEKDVEGTYSRKSHFFRSHIQYKYIMGVVDDTNLVAHYVVPTLCARRRWTSFRCSSYQSTTNTSSMVPIAHALLSVARMQVRIILTTPYDCSRVLLGYFVSKTNLSSLDRQHYDIVCC